MAAGLAGGLLSIGNNLISRIFPDPEEQAKAKLKLMELEQQGELKELEAQMNVVVAEAKSESSLTRMWRPITMLVLVTIVANNYILYPYISLFWSEAPMLDIPENLWDLIQIGLGGYIVSRGAEKVTAEYCKHKKQ